MTPQKANRIIAEFMGYPSYMINHYKCFKFTKSLDSLVPVWEKLYEEWDPPFQYMTMQFDGCETKNPWCFFTEESIIDGTKGQQSLVNCQWKPTIQEAAAIATAKSIQEMGK